MAASNEPIEAEFWDDIISPRSRPPMGIVQRMAKERESEGSSMTAVQRMAKERESNTATASANNSVSKDAAAIKRAKARRHAKMQGVSSASGNNNYPYVAANASGLSSVSSMGAGKDRYASNKGDDNSYSSKPTPKQSKLLKAAQKQISSNTPPTSNKRQPDARTNRDGASVGVPTNSSYIGLQSLLSADDATIDSAADFDMLDTELYRKFEEAFNMTLRNNPGILPGATTVIDSIKTSMYKVQKSKAEKENEMRKQLDKVKSEKEKLETELRKEMGTAAMRKNELSKELLVARSQKGMQQDVLDKEMAAIKAVKKELTARMSDVTKEKEDLTKHLSFLSKSRAELEQALETEMRLVEKDRDALQGVVAERKKLQKQKLENKELEGKIEQMALAASKEKKALQAEVAELNKFEQHIADLRKQNGQFRQDLEHERGKLKEIAETWQMKKATLQESKAEMEAQYQQEIDELHGQIQETKMMHEKDMEMMVKSRVMNFLGRGGDAAMENGIGIAQSAKITDDQITGSQSEAPLDIEAMINSRVEAELKKKMDADDAERMKKMEAEEAELKRKREAEEAELKRKREADEMKRGLEEEMKRKIAAEEMRLDAELRKRVAAEEMRIEEELKKRMEAKMEAKMKAKMAKKKSKSKSIVEESSDEEYEEEEEDTKENNVYKTRGSLKVDKMKSEIDRLREELEVVQARNPRNSLPPPASREGIREEVASWRDEMKMNQVRYSPGMSSAAYSSLPSPRSSSTPRRSTFQRNNALISPRYDPYQDSEGGILAGGNGSYRDDPEEDRFGITGARRHRQLNTPPLSQRSPRMQRGGATAPSGLGSRYYF